MHSILRCSSTFSTRTGLSSQLVRVLLNARSLPLSLPLHHSVSMSTHAKRPSSPTAPASAASSHQDKKHKHDAASVSSSASSASSTLAATRKALITVTENYVKAEMAKNDGVRVRSSRVCELTSD